MNQFKLLDLKVVPMPFGELNIRDYFLKDDIIYQKTPNWSPVDYNAIRLDTEEAATIDEKVPVVKLHSKLILSKHPIPENIQKL